MEKKKKKFTFPTTATLLLIVVLVMGILTYIIPAGQFDREINEATGREGVVPGSFHYVEQSPVSVTQLFEAPYWGFSMWLILSRSYSSSAARWASSSSLVLYMQVLAPLHAEQVTGAI